MTDGSKFELTMKRSPRTWLRSWRATGLHSSGVGDGWAALERLDPLTRGSLFPVTLSVRPEPS
jgi:hypothetical protein